VEVLHCRGCASNNLKNLFSLGGLPYANTFPEDEVVLPDYKLGLVMCLECELVQLDEYPDLNELFSNYIWKTSSSKHVPNYLVHFVERIFRDYYLPKVIEIASNDGTLMRLLKSKGADVIGVEPAENLFEECLNKNLTVIKDFFSKGFSDKYPELKGEFNALIARNVFCHVEDMHVFLLEAHAILSSEGICILEFHDGGKLLDLLQFDSIYHEHQSYLTLPALENIVANTSFGIVDVTETFVGGGALLVILKKGKNFATHTSVIASRHLGHNNYSRWRSMGNAVEAYKVRLNELLKNLKKDFRLIGFGASARSTTLANFTGCWVHLDIIADNASDKHGRFWTGTEMRICSPKEINWQEGDIVVLFAWNFYDEIKHQLLKLGFRGKILKVLPNLPTVEDITFERN
jgi:SAM-dependent methyltransferase